jgi:transglutaminase-like putative cysteine protease
VVAETAAFLLAGTVPFLLPALLRVLLQAGIPWPLLAGIVGLKTAAALLAARAPSRPAAGGPARPAAVFRRLSPALTVLLAAAVLTGILITPYSAYRIWFESVREGAPQGSVSNLFVLVAALYSSSFSPLFLTAGAFLPLYLQALAAAGLLAVVRQETVYYGLLLGLLAAGSGYLAVRYVARGNRWRGLLLLLGLLAVALTAAWGSAGLVEPRGSRVVDERLHPGLRQAVSALFPRFPLLYGIPGFGYGFSEKRLGGTPVLSEAPIFEVDPPEAGRLYLRTAVYDRYDGSSWSRSEEPAAGAGPPAGAGRAAGPPEGRADAPAAGFLAGVGEADRPPAGSVRITVRAEYYGLLPHTLDTRRLHLPAGREESARGSFEAGFELEEPLRRGQSIWLERDGPAGRAPPDLSPRERAGLLQLAEGLSADLLALARSLSGPGGDRIATLRRIERFLADGYAYNLQVRRAPAGKDFVEYFLFGSREGYCVHFASAFVVLARLNGIPARYATGFLTPPGGGPPETLEEPGPVVVTGLSAHAWPEVWLEEHGWTAWEATTAVNPDYYGELERGWLYRREARDNRLTGRQLRAILGREAVGAPQAGARTPAVPWAALLPAAGLAAAALLAAGLVRRYGVLLSPARPDRRQALRLVERIRRSQRRAGLPAPRAVGWVAWGRALARARPAAAAHAERLVAVILQAAYSSRPVLRRDVRFLRGFYLRYGIRRDPASNRPSVSAGG